MRILAALFLIAGLQPAIAQEAGQPAELVVIDLRPQGRKGRLRACGAERQVQRGCVSHPRCRDRPAQGRRAQGGSRAAAVGRRRGKTLTVLNWSIYYNKQVQGGGGGLERRRRRRLYDPRPGRKRSTPGSNCSQKESAGGWYEGRRALVDVFPAHLGIRGHLRRQAGERARRAFAAARNSRESSRATATTRRQSPRDRPQDRRGGRHAPSCSSRRHAPCATSPSCRPARSRCGVS